MMRASLLTKTLGALFALFLLGAGYALATPISVNKQFATPTTNLGASTNVTVTFQNNDQTNAATISAFKDDIATMAGGAILNTAVTPTTTCAGGTPAISGTAIVMNNGTIPKAPNGTTPGSCTLTFAVIGAIAGNSVNTISAANVVTSLGSPPGDVSQTLNVAPVNVPVAAGANQTVAVTATPNSVTSTLTYTITNPTATVPLTNVAFPINLNTAGGSPAYAFTVSSATTNCGATAGALPSGTTGTINFSGGTIPAGGSCTVTVMVTSNATTTNAPDVVNLSLPASGSCGTANPQRVCSDQGITNSASATNTATFRVANPNVTKSFTPGAIQQGQTTVLKISIQNILAIPLTGASITDSLPAGLAVYTTPGASITGTGCTGTFAPNAGDTSVSLSGGTIPANTTCVLSVTVIANSFPIAQNIIPKGPAPGSFNSNEVSGAAANATANLTVVGPGGSVTASKSVTYPPPNSGGVGPFTPVTFSITFTSVAGGSLTAGTFTDTLPQTPQPMQVVGFPSGVTANQCGGTITLDTVHQVVSGSGLNVPAASLPCTVQFTAQFTQITPGVNKTNTNTVTTSVGNASANVVEQPVITLSNYYATTNNGQSLINQPVTVQAQIADTSGTADSNLYAVFNLRSASGAVQLPANPNFSFSGCPAGVTAANVTIAANRESFTVYVPSINSTCTIQYSVVDENNAAGTFTPGTSYYTSANTNCPTGNPTTCTASNQQSQAFTATKNVNFQTSNINITKLFTPNQIQAGSISVASIGLSVQPVSGFTTTIVSGVTVPDPLPAGMNFATNPNVGFTAGCGAGPTYTIAGSTITASNITLSTATGTCTITFSVTANSLGAPVNVIGAGQVTSTGSITNSQSVSASLTIAAGVAVAKTFLTSTLAIGQTTYMRLLFTNSASTTTLTGGTLTDTMPTQLALASTTPGPIQAGDPALCGGAITGTLGSNTFKITGLTMPPLVGTTPGQCVVYVLVGATSTAAPGTYTNTIPVGGLTISSYSNQTPTSANITLNPPPNPTLTKAFAPATIAPTGISVLTITVANTASGATALSGMSLTDPLPSGVTVATTPNASTTCGAGTVTASGSSVSLANGSVAANATCTITVSVTSPATGSYVNTIPASAITTTQGATNTAPATSTLNVVDAPAVTLTKSFSPVQIAAGGTSVLTLTVANTSTGAIALSSLALTDTLPANVKIAAIPAGATTCGAGTVSATPSGPSVALTGGSVAAGATCTISVSVTSSVPGVYLNTVPGGAVTSAQGASNTAPATATLEVGSPPAVTLSKAFSPAQILPGGTSLLTITVANTASGAFPLTALALSDALPANVFLAAAPNASTTCGSGTVTAAGGGTSVALSGGSIAAAATCTITVTVTSAVPGTYVNTIPSGNVSSAQGASNTAPATANLNVANAPAVTLSKAFAPAQILPGGTSTLTISVANSASGAIALTGLSLSDTLPSNVFLAATPNASTTCGSGTVTAAGGGTSVALSGGSVAAAATCTITVTVTSAVPGSYLNSIPGGNVTSNQGASNPAPATATLMVNTAPSVSLSKSFAPTQILPGGLSTLTITVANTASGAVPLTGLTLSDTLPANVTLAASPNASTTCGSGTVSAAGGGSSIGLSGGSLGAAATCTVTVAVTSSITGSYVNTIPAGNVSSTQGASNGSPASATITVANAPSVTLSKVFSPAQILPGGVSALTISIANTASGALPLTGLSLTDALPANVSVAASPNASTTCGSGTVTAAAGGTSVALGGGSVGAAASCTVTVNVTSSVPGSYLNTIPSGSVSSTQGASNTSPATATLTVTNAPPVSLTKAFSPALIAPGATSTLTISIANTSTGAIALTALGVTDKLPAGITVAAAPNASTTCAGGSVSAAAGATAVALSGGTLAAGATCTITVAVTGTTAGTYTNTIPAGTVTSAQGASNGSPAQAQLVIGQPQLAVVKTSNPSGANVSPGQTIAYTIAVTNTGSVTETNARITSDTLVNATLVPGSVTVNGAAAPDSVITGGTPIGSIAPGATTTITYAAIVNATVPNNAQVTNNVTVGGDQPCAGATCSSVSPPNTVRLPVLTISKLVDGQTSENVVSGQTVTYGITLGNSGVVAALHSVLTDVVPNGVVPVAGSVTVNGAPAPGATVNGQTVTVPLGSIGPGATLLVAFKATVNLTVGSAINTASITATGGSALESNPASIHIEPPTIAVTKTASATTVSSGDRVNYSIVVAPSNGIPYSTTTVVDTLPAFEIYAPGSARVNGKPQEPVVSGRTLTWTLPSLASPATITYSVAIAPGAPPNATLTNVVDVSAIAPGGAPPGRGSASASVLVTGTAFGSCYPITGRVFLDSAGTGRFQDPDVGLGNVRIFLDNGEHVTTDATGRYSFPCVQPGMHALRLDETSLPQGVKAYDDRNIDSTKSTRRLVHKLYDTYIIEDINFAVTGAPAPR